MNDVFENYDEELKQQLEHLTQLLDARDFGGDLGPKEQRNLWLPRRTNAQLAALRTAYGGYSAAVVIAIEDLYNKAIASPADMERLVMAVKGWLTQSLDAVIRVKLSHEPSQSYADVPEWTTLLCRPEALEDLEAALADLGLYAVVIGEDFVTLRTVEVLESMGSTETQTGDMA